MRRMEWKDARYDAELSSLSGSGSLMGLIMGRCARVSESASACMGKVERFDLSAVDVCRVLRYAVGSV